MKIIGGDIIGGTIKDGVVNGGVVAFGGSVTLSGCAVGPGATIVNGADTDPDD